MRKAVPNHITSKLTKASDGEENGKSGHRKMIFTFREMKIRGEGIVITDSASGMMVEQQHTQITNTKKQST